MNPLRILTYLVLLSAIAVKQAVARSFGTAA